MSKLFRLESGRNPSRSPIAGPETPLRNTRWKPRSAWQALKVTFTENMFHKSPPQEAWISTKRAAEMKVVICIASKLFGTSAYRPPGAVRLNEEAMEYTMFLFFVDTCDSYAPSVPSTPRQPMLGTRAMHIQ